MVDDVDDGSLDDTLKGGRDDDATPVDDAHAATVHLGGPGAPSMAPTATIRPLPPPPSGPAAPPSGIGAPPIAAGARRYKLGDRIGRGGMGEVVGAYDEQIGRDVAVKRILSASPNADEYTRFMREARVQGRLQHPAIVPVHDLGIDDDGRPYFVMKRLDGESMHDLLKKLADGFADVPALRRRLLRAFVDVCQAIELAHQKKIVHRDIKPANIMLGDLGEVYVLDWGVARILGDDGPSPSNPIGEVPVDDQMTRVGSILGTPAYMAPEQLVGEPATSAADVYSLGCVLFEIVAAEALHPRNRSPGTITTPNARPSLRRPDAPPELDAICVRATATDPEKRYPSAKMLADVVLAFLDGDRDIAVRRELAVIHLTRATEALGRNERSEAMREAGRALALDPESSDAALLVTKLMLEPPKTTPPEVEARLAELDMEAAKFQGRLSGFSMLGYLGFVPFMLWTGVRQPWIVVAFTVLTLLSGAQVWSLVRGNVIRESGIYLNALLQAALLAMVARMVGPFMIVPTLVATTLMAYAVHPRFGRIRIVAIILGAGMAVPWLLEVVGILSSTYSFENGRMVTNPAAIDLSSVPVQIAFAALLVSVLAIVALLARTLAMRQRDVTRKIELQAWQLRQLVPAQT